MSNSALPFEILPADVKAQLDAGERIVLIDVREHHEHALCSIDGSHLVPMNTVPAKLPALEAAAEEARLIVFCHHGMRSLNVVSWLRQQGVDACQSMAGGIDRWSIEIDPNVPRY